MGSFRSILLPLLPYPPPTIHKHIPTSLLVAAEIEDLEDEVTRLQGENRRATASARLLQEQLTELEEEVRACVRARVCVCMSACVCLHPHLFLDLFPLSPSPSAPSCRAVRR